MIFFKILISSFVLLSNSPSDPGVKGDGWVVVERPDKMTRAEGADERDPSIGVVFSKQIGLEKFLIRFPEEPTYRYMSPEGDQIEVLSISGGAEHRLQVIEKIFTSTDELLDARKQQLDGVYIVAKSAEKKSADLIYWKEGFWHLERLIASERYTYFLQTKSLELESAAHHIFVQSFDLDLDRK